MSASKRKEKEAKNIELEPIVEKEKDEEVKEAKEVKEIQDNEIPSFKLKENAKLEENEN